MTASPSSSSTLDSSAATCSCARGSSCRSPGRRFAMARSWFPANASPPWAAGASCPRRADRRRLDLGDAILMPGLVNAHCHLDYTDMAGQFPPPKASATGSSSSPRKAGWSYSDFAESWLHGAQMLVRTGTTTVADIEAVPDCCRSLGRHAAAGVFVPGNDRRQRPAASRTRLAGSGGANRVADAAPLCARAFRRMRPTPPCRSCCA